MSGGRAWLVAPVLAGAVLVGASCSSQDALAYARQACSHVDRSIALYKQATANPPPPNASALEEQAIIQLRDGLQPAALAAADNGQWQALRTTLSESPRVSEAHLVSALTQQCHDAAQPGGIP